MTWICPAPEAVGGLLTAGPMPGADRAVLTGYLARQRATLLNVCAGLTAAQLAVRAVPPSNLSLLGLILSEQSTDRTAATKEATKPEVPDEHHGHLTVELDPEGTTASSVRGGCMKGRSCP